MSLATKYLYVDISDAVRLGAKTEQTEWYENTQNVNV